RTRHLSTRDTRAWWGNALLEPPDSVADQQRVSQKVHLRPAAEATAASYSILRYQTVLEALSVPNSVPSARHADFSIKNPPCNSWLQRGLQCRGDWIRTSDLLNPIQEAASKKGRFSEPFRNQRFPSIVLVRSASCFSTGTLSAQAPGNKAE